MLQVDSAIYTLSAAAAASDLQLITKGYSKDQVSFIKGKEVLLQNKVSTVAVAATFTQSRSGGRVSGPSLQRQGQAGSLHPAREMEKPKPA